MTRRQVVAGAGLLLVGGLSGCSTSSDGPAPPTPSGPTPSPTTAKDASLRSAAAERVRVLLAAYDDALTGRGPADPASAPLLALRADHAAHLQALIGEVPAPARTTEPPRSATPGQVPQATQTPAPPAPGPAPGPVPTGQLLVAERLAEAGNVDDAASASRGLARLLASIAACEASHEVALGALAAG